MTNIIDGAYVHVGIDIDDDVKIDDRNKCVLFPRKLLIEKTEKFIKDQVWYDLEDTIILEKSALKATCDKATITIDMDSLKSSRFSE